MTAETASALIAAIGLFLGVFSLMLNASVNLRNKRMDVILHCNERYDDLARARSNIDREIGRDIQILSSIPTHDPIRDYFRRYWGLKSDQIDYWLAGYVDPETLTSWLLSTVDVMSSQYVELERVGGVTYIEGWKTINYKHDKINPELKKLVDEINTNIVSEDNRERQIALLHCHLVKVENRQRRLIKLLASAWRHRQEMRRLEHTLDEGLKLAIKSVRRDERPRG